MVMRMKKSLIDRGGRKISNTDWDNLEDETPPPFCFTAPVALTERGRAWLRGGNKKFTWMTPVEVPR